MSQRALALGLLACLGLLAGCASRKIVVTELDKAVTAVQQSMIVAQCRGAKLKGDTKAEFFVKTAYNVTVGAPTGAIPIALSGGTSVEESSTVTVTLDESSTPTAQDCEKLLRSPTAKRFVYERGVVREVPVEESVLLYDPSTGTVTRVQTQELERKLR